MSALQAEGGALFIGYFLALLEGTLDQESLYRQSCLGNCAPNVVEHGSK
jgi:hypothetical protein